jgi:protein-S-isoprenylcysteine O-methyltransferase Ste14
VIAFFVPRWIDPGLVPQWPVGWVSIAGGVVVYALCLLRFLASGGTPAIFFTRPLRFLLGQEPRVVVSDGLYRFSRNPMYVGVLLAVFGQAILFASVRLAVYGVFLAACFHVVVVFMEEPHLLKRNGEPYAQYCRKIPRWFGIPK